MNKKLAFFFIATLSFFVWIYFHTNTIEISTHKVTLGNSGKKLKIAHITDLHTKGVGRLETQLLQALASQKPDLIVITGDLATPSGTVSGYEEVLKHLRAPKGVYFVQGNWEYWEPIAELKRLLNKWKITDLTNEVKEIDSGLWLIGFDDEIEGHADEKIIKRVPPTSLKIALFHSPIFFKKLIGKVNLALAGHSHGGQIRFPFFKSFWLPQGTGSYDQGWFTEGTSELFVSRGIGTSILPIRVNCSPEIAFIEVSY
jgi:predicted MPP superfamily phosphohydrolase